MSDPFDVVVIGGGHNGLVAAGLLAKHGAHVVVLERRSQVGGAAITESPWGPQYNVTSLSYVVSLMPPTVTRELELARHGYHVYPQGGYFAPHRDGRARCSSHRRASASSPSETSTRTRVGSSGSRVSPTCSGRSSTSIPPRLGSRRRYRCGTSLG